MAWIEPEVRPGSLLVSSTDLTEPAFRRTVIYMIEHNDAGSLGVVVNRPSETAVQNVLPQWSPLTAHPSALYIGGPVKRDSALCLGIARNGARIDGVAGLRWIWTRTRRSLLLWSKGSAFLPGTRVGLWASWIRSSSVKTGW